MHRWPNKGFQNVVPHHHHPHHHGSANSEDSPKTHWIRNSKDGYKSSVLTSSHCDSEALRFGNQC